MRTRSLLSFLVATLLSVPALAKTTVESFKVKDKSLIASFDTSLGHWGGTPLHRLGQTSISYSFDRKPGHVEVTVRRGDRDETISFRTLSGDWFAGTLSTCGRFLVLAEPYLLECYEFV